MQWLKSQGSRAFIIRSELGNQVQALTCFVHTSFYFSWKKLTFLSGSSMAPNRIDRITIIDYKPFLSVSPLPCSSPSFQNFELRSIYKKNTIRYGNHHIQIDFCFGQNHIFIFLLGAEPAMSRIPKKKNFYNSTCFIMKKDKLSVAPLTTGLPQPKMNKQFHVFPTMNKNIWGSEMK